MGTCTLCGMVDNGRSCRNTYIGEESCRFPAKYFRFANLNAELVTGLKISPTFPGLHLDAPSMPAFTLVLRDETLQMACLINATRSDDSCRWIREGVFAQRWNSRLYDEWVQVSHNWELLCFRIDNHV